MLAADTLQFAFSQICFSPTKPTLPLLASLLIVGFNPAVWAESLLLAEYWHADFVTTFSENSLKADFASQAYNCQAHSSKLHSCFISIGLSSVVEC